MQMLQGCVPHSLGSWHARSPSAAAPARWKAAMGLTALQEDEDADEGTGAGGGWLHGLAGNRNQKPSKRADLLRRC